jgi:hypothetical protein
MTRPRLELDHGGLDEVLKRTMRGTVSGAAERIAANVRAQGRTTSDGDLLPVEVSDYTTDRAASSVTISHPAGLPMQAKYGVLTQAAAAAGLEVRSR